ncbi:proline dehydrogenase [candidate division LCP-89 bacterium B3_LCP]|uniref:proline dehydrogenase n=1 Tax=candidate division LCP-89 bacterium B3_LCP TaxID=2012998 RepID=A0A532V6B9_UNCL8|nr:MAG: proline dehydrogenase [candidate division LCP-89 bacterium B3_LCP]
MDIVNRIIAETLPLVPKPIVGYFSSRYIAGETIDDAVETTRRLNAQGACVTIDVLGEHIVHREEASTYAEHYLHILDVINAEKLDANISLKPTQMGLKLDRKFCLETIGKIAEKATGLNNFMCIDMEDNSCTEDTLWLYEQLKDSCSVGTVLQAYMRRSDADLDRLIPHQVNLRLCKGIYVEPYAIAYKDREIIRFNFLHLLERLLQSGCYVGIATHDEFLVWGALHLLKKLEVPKDRYEFQMLLGVEERLREILIRDGHKLRVYVPFGMHWHAYSVRRLKENPQIAGYVLHNLFKKN